MPRNKPKQTEMKVVTPALKSSIVAMIFTITAILVFALIVKSAEIDVKVIVIINEIIKIAGVICASFFAAKDPKSKTVLAAAVAGLLYIVIGFCVFSLIQGAMGDLMMMLTDAMMGVIIGFVVGLFVSKIIKTKAAGKPSGKAA
jgi:putative membrane protein (TIGR04086 family)